MVFFKPEKILFWNNNYVHYKLNSYFWFKLFPEIFFEYKYDYQNKLRSTAFALFWEKYEHCKWFIGETWYCPQQNKYTLEISLQGKRLDYIHHGLLEDIQYIKISNFFLENYPEYII